MGRNNIREKWERIKFHSSNFGWKIVYDWSFSLAALLSYNLLVSILPLILCLFSVISLVFNYDPAVLINVRTRLVAAFPQQDIADVVDTLLISVSKSAGLVFFISFAVSVFTGSRLLIGMDDVLTLVYRLRERTIVKQNVHAIISLLGFIILIPALIISSSAPALLTKNEGLYQYGVSLSSGIFGFLVFELAYYYIPNRKMSWRKTWCGALFGAVGLQIIFLLFPLYVHSFMSNYVGQFGFVIVAVLLFYLIGLLFVIGAQINAYFFDDIQPFPIGLGTLLSRSGDRENALLIDTELQPKESMSTLKEGLNPER